MLEKGYSNGEIGKEWLETVFGPQTKTKAGSLPHLLVINGHSSHYTYEFLDYAQLNNIVVICLPPHTTHGLQSMLLNFFGGLGLTKSILALDVLGFSQFKNAWQSVLNQWESENKGPLDKAAFLKEIKGLWGVAFTPKNVKKSFKVVGIWPFNPNIIPAKVFAPSLPNSAKQPPLMQDTEAQKAMRAVFANILAVPVVPLPNLHSSADSATTGPLPALKTPQISAPAPSTSCANRIQTLLQDNEHHFIVNCDPVSPSRPMPAWNPPVLLHPKPTATSVYGSIGFDCTQWRQSKIHTENLALQHDVAQLSDYASGLQDIIQKFEVNMTLQSMLLTQTQNQLQNEWHKKKKSSHHLLPPGVATLLTTDDFDSKVKEHKENTDAEAVAKAARWLAKASKGAQTTLNKVERDCLKADYHSRLAIWKQQVEGLHAKGVKLKDCPDRPCDLTCKGYKSVEQTVESSSDSKAASISEEESKSGWISGAAENDKYEALSEANDLDN